MARPPPLDHHRLFRTASSSYNDGGGGGCGEVLHISPVAKKTVDDVWNEIVAGNGRKQCKEEAIEDDDDDDVMTLEDFLARAEAIDGEEEDVKMPPSLMFSFDSGPISPFQAGATVDEGFEGDGSGRGQGKRRGPVLKSLDKITQQRQRRMIKNRESAARSRERKQAYQAELEAMAIKLEEENEQLLKEKAQRTKDRYKLLMEKVLPGIKKRKTVAVLRRVRSMQW